MEKKDDKNINDFIKYILYSSYEGDEIIFNYIQNDKKMTETEVVITEGEMEHGK